ncbi:MAG: hypothetical protein ABI540_06100 [Spartobacteria bacterium]
MPACPGKERYSLGRSSLSLFLAIALLAAAVLGAFPAMHENLHPEAGHLCVVKLFASGGYAATTPAPVFTAPEMLSLPEALPLPTLLDCSGPRFFSLLEHAPPARA